MDRPLATLVVLALTACGAAPPGGRAPADATRADAAVVYLSTECSGALVGPRAVLTAAHCVEDPGPWWVRVEAAGRQRVAVRRCRVHPEAYDTPRPCGAGPGRTTPAHDLAVLELEGAPRGVRPLEVLLAEPHPSPRWWRDRRVRLVGWDRQPRLVGPLARRSGPNRIATLADDHLVTVPVGRRGFATHIGDSGGPALLSQASGERVLGVLFGGSAPGSRASVYVPTYRPDNARWLVRAAGVGRDLGHLDPDDPWDHADWTDLALRLGAGAAGPGARDPQP